MSFERQKSERAQHYCLEKPRRSTKTRPPSAARSVKRLDRVDAESEREKNPACSRDRTKRPESKSRNQNPQKTANQPVVLGDFDPVVDEECLSVLHRENYPLTSRRAAARGTLLRSAKIPDATARTVLPTKTSNATTFRSPPH